MQKAAITKLSIGTAQLGSRYGISNIQGKTSDKEAGRILRFAEQVGIETLDTAVAYGESEDVLGRLSVEKWNVISKLPVVPFDCVDVKNWGINQVSNSLSRLRVSSLYGLLLHRPSQLLDTNGDKIYQLLQVLKKDGFVKKIGISIYNTSELDVLVKNYEFDIIQAPFNVFDNRLLKSGWLAKLASLNVELHARSIFLQGLLLMPLNNRPARFLRWQDRWLMWDEWLRENNLSPLQACINHVLSIKEIKNIVVGIENLNQLKEVVNSLNDKAPEIPQELYVNDDDLLNPSKWDLLC